VELGRLLYSEGKGNTLGNTRHSHIPAMNAPHSQLQLVHRQEMRTRLTWQLAEKLARAFWDKYPTLVYKPDYLRYSDWFTMPTASNRLPDPICRTLVRGWLAHLLTEQGIVATDSNLLRVMKWVKGGRNA